MVYITRLEHFNAAHKLYNPGWSKEKNEEMFGACANENWHGLKEELGDLLLHIIFYSKIGSEKQEFTFDDVRVALGKINDDSRIVTISQEEF